MSAFESAAPDAWRAAPDGGAAITGLTALLSGLEDDAGDEAALGLDTLLFLPLAPVIDAAPDWRPDVPGIPATALPALGAMVRDALGRAATAAMCAAAPDLAGRAGAIARAGSLLWPRAAQVLETASRPDGWAATGLPARAFAPVALGVGGVLSVAPEVETLAAFGAAGPLAAQHDPAEVLARAANRGPESWALVLQVLLARVARPDAVLRLIASARGVGQSAPLRAATERAIAALLERIARRGGSRGPLGLLGLRDAGLEIQRLVRLLDCAAGDGAGPDRRRHAEALRQRLGASAEDRFRAGLAESLVAPLRALRSPPGPAQVQALEDAARDLRRLEAGARAVGGTAPLDLLLRATTAMLAEMEPDAPLGLVERARLIEILTGPEDAVALLTRAGGGAWPGVTRTA